MLEHLNISFPWTNINDGFAFVCMKTAYQYGITGKMNYGPSIGAVIEAEGEKERIAEFLGWINNNVIDYKYIKQQKSAQPERKYMEFDIEYLPA